MMRFWPTFRIFFFQENEITFYNIYFLCTYMIYSVFVKTESKVIRRQSDVEVF